MIHPSTFLSRALLADAIFSGVAAVALTLGAGALAPFLNLPEALLRETGLFLIAYTALVGWLATRSIGGEGAGVARDRRQCRLDARQHRAAVLGRGVAEPARPGLHRRPGDCDRRVCRAAVYRPAQERRRRWRPELAVIASEAKQSSPPLLSMDCFVASLPCANASRLSQAMTEKTAQLNTTAAIIPANVSTSPMTSIGTRLLPEYGSACFLVRDDMCTIGH